MESTALVQSSLKPLYALSPSGSEETCSLQRKLRNAATRIPDSCSDVSRPAFSSVCLGRGHGFGSQDGTTSENSPLRWNPDLPRANPIGHLCSSTGKHISALWSRIHWVSTLPSTSCQDSILGCWRGAACLYRMGLISSQGDLRQGGPRMPLSIYGCRELPTRRDTWEVTICFVLAHGHPSGCSLHQVCPLILDPSHGTSSVVEIWNVGILTFDLSLVPWPCSHLPIHLNPPSIQGGRGYNSLCSPSGT